MRLRSVVSRHRSAVVTAVVCMGVVSTIVAVAVASGGYSAERVDLGDAAVWVANDDLESVGRANTAVHELNTIVETGGSAGQIAQRGQTVLALDQERATVSVIDPMNSTVAETVAVPPSSSIAITESKVVVASDGDVWTMPSDQIVDLQVDSDPTFRFGPGAVVSVAPDGRLFSYAPLAGIVQRVDVDDSESVVEQWQTEPSDPAAEVQITSVDGRWAVLDERSMTLLLADRAVDLGDVMDIADDPRLQEPAVDGDAIAIASRAGLVMVDLTDGGIREMEVRQAGGIATAPVRHGDCLHAAWSNGTAWRACAGEAPRSFPLDEMATSADLAYLANGRSLVLSDRASGRSWAASTDYGVIDNWDELLATETDDEIVERQDADAPAPIERSQADPIAVADAFGARPGRASMLPVLMNDYDPNGDVLVIEELVAVPPPGVRLDLVSDRQQVQVTVDDTVTEGFSFGYTVDDGRGGSATASVTVQVRTDDENGPPEQVRDRTATVALGGRSTTAVLGDWVDPDGDPFFLYSATPPEGDTASFTPEGSVVFDERQGQQATRRVALVAHDGRDEGAGSLEIDVRAPGTVPLIAESFVVLATAGEEVRIDPLRHVHGGTGNVVLTSVPAKQDVLITPDYDGGTFRFKSSAERTHYLEYVVTDESSPPVTGLIRVEVEAGSDRDTMPITVPHTAFLRAQQPMDVDVLATDIDPTGGVLVLTDLIDAESNDLRVEVIDHRILRVQLLGPLPLGSLTFGYRVSNGLGDADGAVTVVEVPSPPVAQPPVANPDTASVRTGDVIDVPVLANDEHPDGLPLTLDPVPVEDPLDGLLFVSGDRLRYFAPEKPGEYDAQYRIRAAGQSATATVHFSVRPTDPETNSPPVPPEVTARALAGDTVRISVALGGTDPDGDSVLLVGQESNPELGSVSETGPDWLDYRAGEYSAGTDTFTYAVVDALGAKAMGTIRVGIAARPDGARNPVAVEDSVLVRPGRTLSARVLENDSDPDGGSLTLTDVTPQNGGASAEVVGDRIDVVVPEGDGEYGFQYAIENERLGSDSSFLTVVAREDAPLARPEVDDVVLNLTDILDRDRVDVDVLADAFLADADVADLEVGLVPGFDEGAEVLRDGSIRVAVEDRRRIIPFSLTRPDDADVVSYAFIRVPGRDDAIPQLRRDAPDVEVRSGESVELHIEDYVIAASGRPVSILDAASVRAAHSDGTDPWVDERTLRFRSEAGYFGPASISFTATDGESASDPTGRTATIVIPIDVRPTRNQAPAFAGGSIDFEQGVAKTIDLVKLTTYPDKEQADELEYRLLEPLPDGFGFELDEHRLTITPSAATPSGTRGSVAVSVIDGSGDGEPGRIDLQVVASTRPLARPISDRAVAQRGTTTSVDVLANDDTTNPFPDTPLRVVALRGLDTLPAGVSVTPDADRSTLLVKVSEDAEPVNATLQYQVADATDDPDRYAWGTVTVSVQDRPDPVTAPRVTGFGDRRLDLVFGAGAFNNSPITAYEISLVEPGSSEVLAKTECTATTCLVPTLGNGRANGVVLRVQARNAIGLSDPVDAPGPIWSDVVPPAPRDLAAGPLDGRLRLGWSPVSAGAGSPVHSYVLVVGGVPVEVDAAAVCTASRCEVDSRALENGSLVEFSVSARNEAYPAMAVWADARGSGTPFGPPVAGGISVVGDAIAGTVTVSWTPFGGNGDPIGGYFVQRLADGSTAPPSGPQSCMVTSPAPGTVVAPSRGGTVSDMVQVGPDASSVQFTGTTAEAARYSFVVWGYNRSACVSTGVGTVVVREPPGPITSVESGMGWMTQDAWDRYISRVDPNQRLQIVAVDANGAQLGAPRDFAGSGWLRAVLGRPFGETARFQLRTCSPWGSCGPWSEILPADAEPSLTFALPSRVWDPELGSWSWDSEPDNSGIPAEFRCGVVGDDVGVRAQRRTSCQVPDAQPGDRVWLDVEVAGVKVRYQNP